MKEDVHSSEENYENKISLRFITAKLSFVAAKRFATTKLSFAEAKRFATTKTPFVAAKEGSIK